MTTRRWSRARLAVITFGVALSAVACAFPYPSSAELWKALHPGRIPPELIFMGCIFALWSRRIASLGFASAIALWISGVWVRAHYEVRGGMADHPKYQGEFYGWPIIVFLLL